MFRPENCKDGVVSAKMGDVANNRLSSVNINMIDMLLSVNIKAALISKGKR